MLAGVKITAEEAEKLLDKLGGAGATRGAAEDPAAEDSVARRQSSATCASWWTAPTATR